MGGGSDYGSGGQNVGMGGDSYGSAGQGSDSYGSGGKGSDSYGSGGQGSDSYSSGEQGGDSYRSGGQGSDSYGSSGMGGQSAGIGGESGMTGGPSGMGGGGSGYDQSGGMSQGGGYDQNSGMGGGNSDNYNSGMYTVLSCHSSKHKKPMPFRFSYSTDMHKLCLRHQDFAMNLHMIFMSSWSSIGPSFHFGLKSCVLVLAAARRLMSWMCAKACDMTSKCKPDCAYLQRSHCMPWVALCQHNGATALVNTGKTTLSMAASLGKLKLFSLHSSIINSLLK